MTLLRSHTFDDWYCDGYGRRGPISVWNTSAVHHGRRVVSFLAFAMGQYFKAVNLDKQEVVCPWCLSGGAKLWEWAANSQGAVFTLLLRKSSAGGGGDYYGYRQQKIEFDTDSAERVHESFFEAFRSVASLEGQSIAPEPGSIVGRWAGDRVALVGDYDKSEIWNELLTYRNVSRELVQAWNDFVEIDDMKLKFNPTCSCQQKD